MKSSPILVDHILPYFYREVDVLSPATSLGISCNIFFFMKVEQILQKKSCSVNSLGIDPISGIFYAEGNRVINEI